MAEGRPEGITALERMETMDFYNFYRAWKKRQDQIAKAYQNG